MKRDRRKRNSAYEVLEPRRLLAGDVTVVESGQLFIRGDDSSNQIQIVATEEGQVLVKGLNNTTINGGTDAFIVSGSNDLQGARGRNASFDGGLNINLNGGHDRIDVRSLELQGNSWISTGEGNDLLRLHRSTSHDLDVLSGQGDDTLRLFQSRAKGDLNVRTGDGQDEIRVWNSRVLKDAVLITGAHDDTVTAKKSRFTGDTQQIFTQGGEDRVSFSKNSVNNSGITVHTGADNDRVFASIAQDDDILGMIEFHGQSGMDALLMDGSNSEMVSSDGFENNGGEVVFAHTGEIDSSLEVFDLGERARQFGAERVQFGETTVVSSVQWEGTYYSNSEAIQDIFVIEIYEDTFLETQYEGDYNAPIGEPIASFTVGDGVGEDVARTDTGKILDDPSDPWFIDRNIYSYEADIAFQMQADTAYWVSIHTIKSDQVGDDARSFELGLLPYDATIVNQSAFFTGGYNNQGEFVSFWLPSARWNIALRS